MGCCLRVSGENFAVDDFLDRIAFEIETVWHKGEMNIIPSRPPHSTSGFNLRVSDANFKDFKGQLSNVMDFFKCNPDGFLTKLKEAPEIDNATLDFGLAMKHGVCAQYEYFPPELLRLAATYNIGIEVSHYWMSSEPESCTEGCNLAEGG